MFIPRGERAARPLVRVPGPGIPCLEFPRSAPGDVMINHSVAVLPRRRDFLRAAAGVAGLSSLRSAARAADGTVPPGERLGVALIGRGVMGTGHLKFLLGRPDLQVLAVCDADRTRRDEGCAIANEAYAAERGSGNYRGCESVNDYRELLARPDIDAVVIATPDHWHSLMAIEAARAGKDVYCEKPVSLTVGEGRELVDGGPPLRLRVPDRARNTARIPVIRRVCEFVRAGGLGKVKSVFTQWRKLQVPGDRSVLHSVGTILAGRAGAGGLDWDLWVGPAAVAAVQPALPSQPAAGRGAVGVLRGLRRGRGDRLPLARRGRDPIRPRHGNKRAGRDHSPEQRAVSRR